MIDLCIFYLPLFMNVIVNKNRSKHTQSLLIVPSLLSYPLRTADSKNNHFKNQITTDFLGVYFNMWKK